MSQRRFNEEQDAEAVRLYREGLSTIKIAKQFGVGKQVVLKTLIRKGIERRSCTCGVPRPLTHEEKIELTKIYTVGKVTATKIANGYKRSVTQVCAYLKQLGIVNRGSRNFTDEEEDQIAKIYCAGYGVKRIARAYHLSHHTSISSALERKGIPIRPNSVANRLYIIDPYVFDNLNEESAYWWGFLYADGYINKRSLIVGLQGKDRSHLEKLASFLHSNAPIKNRLDTTRKYQICELFVTHKHLANRLIELGIVKGRNEPDKVMNMLPPELYSHWIRGLFDGDGSANIQNHSLAISLCGSRTIMFWLHKIIHQTIGAKANPHKHTKSSIYYISIHGNRIARLFGDYIYKDATVWLDRKKTKIDTAPVFIKRRRDFHDDFINRQPPGEEGG